MCVCARVCVCTCVCIYFCMCVCLCVYNIKTQLTSKHEVVEVRNERVPHQPRVVVDGDDVGRQLHGVRRDLVVPGVLIRKSIQFIC